MGDSCGRCWQTTRANQVGCCSPPRYDYLFLEKECWCTFGKLASEKNHAGHLEINMQNIEPQFNFSLSEGECCFDHVSNM